MTFWGWVGGGRGTSYKWLTRKRCYQDLDVTGVRSNAISCYNLIIVGCVGLQAIQCDGVHLIGEHDTVCTGDPVTGVVELKRISPVGNSVVFRCINHGGDEPLNLCLFRTQCCVHHVNGGQRNSWTCKKGKSYQ